MTFLPRLLFAALLLAAGSASAQCTPRPPVVTSTAGTVGGNGYMFDVVNTSAVGVTVTALGQVMTAAGTSGFSIYTKAGTWVGFDQLPEAWTLAGSANGVTHAGPPNVTTIPIPLSVAIPPGATQGFYIALTTFGPPLCASTGGGTGVMQIIGSDGTISMRSGPMKTNLFAQSVGTPLTAGFVWNGSVTYCTGGSVDATNTDLGRGCGAGYDSFYELFPFASLASLRLAGNSLRFVRTPNGYTGQWLPGSSSSLYRTPVSPTVLNVGGIGSDTFNLTGPGFPTAQGLQTSLDVEADGIVFFGPGIPGFPAAPGFPYSPRLTPNAYTFLNMDRAGVYAWHDYDAAEPGSGPVLGEQIGNFAYVTYDNVESPSDPVASNRSRLQFQFDLTTGDITIVFVQISENSTSQFGSGHLVGISPRGPSRDPGSVNLATDVLSAREEVAALGLAAVSRPRLGTNWSLTVDAIPATAVLGVHILGLTDPSIPDLAQLGLPGCGLRAALDTVRPFVIAGPNRSYSEIIPSTTALSGLSLYAAAAVFQNPPQNQFGAITSNGVRGRIGDY